MTLLEKIQKELLHLTPEKLSEAFDFILFIQHRSDVKPTKKNSLREHPAFGSWHGRNIDALNYQQTIRSEWDNRL